MNAAMRVASLGLGLRQPGDDRPIDERIEGEFVARRIERDRLGKLGRGAGSEHPRQRRQPELRGFVDRRVAGYDIGEPGGQGRIHVAIGDRRRFAGSGLMWDSGEPKRADDGKGGERSFAAQGRATHQPDRNQRVNHQADESRRQEPAAKIDRRRDRKRAFMHEQGTHNWRGPASPPGPRR